MAKKYQLPQSIRELVKFSVPQLLLAGILSSTSYAHSAHGQDVLNQQVEIQSRSTNLKGALAAIEHTSAVRFVFNPKEVPVNHAVKIEGQSSTLREVLDKLLTPLLINYEVKGKQIILFKNGGRHLPLGAETGTVSPVSQTISGRVTNEKGEAIPGTSVVLKGTTIGTATNMDGTYSLTLPEASGTLIFSFLGFVSKEVVIGRETTIDVQLAEDVQKLSEITIVAYGTQRKSDVTGAISTVKAEDLRTQGDNTIQKSLQGRMAGVQIESAGGNPGSGVRMLIRGTGTLSNTDPLYIVDGVQVDNINYLNPTDVASMDVLKDASAAAIYGSRASNGVVLITTKSGKKGDMRVDVSANLGSQKVVKQYDVLNASEWAAVSNAAHDNAGLARLPLANTPGLGEGTNWQKEIYRTAPLQTYNAGASGGGDNYTYSVTGAYFKQDGTVRQTDYDRYNLRVKTDFTKGRLKVGESIILTRENQSPLMQGFVGNNNSPVETAVKMIPAFGVYDPTALGGYAGATGAVTDVPNPVAQLNLTSIQKKTNTALLNLFAEVTIVEGLKYRYNLGYTNTSVDSSGYQQSFVLGAFYTSPLSKLGQYNRKTNYILQEQGSSQKTE